MSLEALRRRRLELALSYGVDLPKPKSLAVEAPGFALGRCYSALFTPQGDHVVTIGANGTFLWGCAARSKLKKLPAPSNPSEICFSPDGSELLLRNDSGKFMRVALPSGEIIAQFNARHPFRLEGCGSYAPDETILQLAYGGVLLQLDGSTGKVLSEYQLEANCYSGEVHWNVDAAEVLVAQTSMADRTNVSRPCALWRWSLPLQTGGPERIRRSWISLHTEIQRETGRLITHFGLGQKGQHVIEVLDLTSLSVIDQFACTGGITPAPALSRDGLSWGVSGDFFLQLGLRGTVVDLPGRGRASFHPSQNLLAVSGDEGFVTSTDRVGALLPALQVVQDEHELSQRGYERMMTLPGRIMPTRLVVYRTPEGLLVQPERESGRRYLPIEDIECGDNPEDLGVALERGLVIARSASAGEDQSGGEGRDFLSGVVSSPRYDCKACVAVAFASDAIDVWPLKAGPKSGFRQHWYPVAAIEPKLRGANLAQVVIRMLGYYRAPK